MISLRRRLVHIELTAERVAALAAKATKLGIALAISASPPSPCRARRGIRCPRASSARRRRWRACRRRYAAPRYLRRARHVPVRIEFVRRLMIVVHAVIVAQRHARRRAALDEIDARAGRHRRHAVLRQAEMIGAEEAALLRLGIGRDRRGSASSARRRDNPPARDLPLPDSVMSCVAPSGRSASRLIAPTMWESGQTGCSAKYSEPSSPCSSSVQKMKAMERCGLGSWAKASASSRIMESPMPLSMAPL